VNKENLDNLTKGSKPSLHHAEADWDVLLGLIQRGSESLGDARNRENSLPTRFAAAYSAAFCLEHAAIIVALVLARWLPHTELGLAFATWVSGVDVNLPAG